MGPEVDPESGTESLDFAPTDFLAVETGWSVSLSAGALAPTFTILFFDELGFIVKQKNLGKFKQQTINIYCTLNYLSRKEFVLNVI